MIKRARVLNLAGSICLLAVLSYLYSIWLFNLPLYSDHIFAACALSAIAYPVFLSAIRSSSRYFEGLLIFLVIITAALLSSEVVYYLKMEAIHHDFGESVGLLAFMGIVLGITAASFYTIAYFASKMFLKMRERN